MKRPRLVHFGTMLRRDATRPTEFGNGIASLLAGLWMLGPYLPPTPSTGYWLWHLLGPTAQGTVLLALGALQILGAGTKWVRLREWVAFALFCAWTYFAAIDFQTAHVGMTPPLVFLPVLGEAWVTVRIYRDGIVNGADRRVDAPYQGPSERAALGSLSAGGARGAAS